MAEYCFQIEKHKMIPAKIGYDFKKKIVSKPSKKYNSINDARKAASNYLIQHDLHWSSPNTAYKTVAVIYKNKESADTLRLYGDVESLTYAKRINKDGKLIPQPKWYP